MSGGLVFDPLCAWCGGGGRVRAPWPNIGLSCHCGKRPKDTPKAPEPAATPPVDLENARRLADDGLEPFDLRRCIRRLADELDAHRAMRAELAALVADLRNEATAAPKAATRVAVWKYHDRLARILGEQS